MATEKKLVPGRVTLLDVRLSFADVYEAKSITRSDGTQSKPKFKANGLISKDGIHPVTGEKLMAIHMGKKMPVMQALKEAKLAAMEKKLGADKAKTAKVKPENYCVRDGDLENWDGYEGNFYISGSNSKQPKAVGRDKRPLNQADGILYSGCHANLIYTMWCQLPGKNEDGTPKPMGVFGSLEAVQFVRGGEAFGAAPVDVDEEFEDITDTSDEFDDVDEGGEGDDEDVL